MTKGLTRSFRRRHRHLALSLAALLGALAITGVIAAGDADQGAPGAAAEPPSRSVGFTPCPSLALREPPSGFRLARSELSALSDNHMGRTLTYRSDEGRTIRVYAGPDLYDALEDLDTTAEVVRARSRRFVLYSTLLAPELLIAVMDTRAMKAPGFDGPCEEAGVLTRHVTRRAMLALLRDLQVERQPDGSTPRR